MRETRFTSRGGDGMSTANGHDASTATQVALDLVLAEAGATTRERFLPGREAIRLGVGLARRPKVAARRGVDLGREIASALAGSSARQPARGDRRFSEPAWTSNWALRRLMQGYLAVGEAVDGFISDAALEWADDRKLRFVGQNLVDALAPTNFALTNPEVLKAAIDTGGSNFVAGARQLARDVRQSPRLPRNVDETKFKVGENLALSPGAVVMRNEALELIQYRPVTPEVRQTPLLIVPPMINKFYITDLAPGKSLIEYLVAQGQQVFAISWRNPTADHRHWGLDEYAAGVLEALDAIEKISGSERTHLVGNCAGGLLAASVSGHLAATGRLDRIASLTLGVCVIDNERGNVVNAMASRRSIGAATLASARKGYLDGADLASMFLWLRPNDLIWPYVVNNWMLGKEPPAFDILYWNADTTRLPAALHRDFMAIAGENRLREPGAVSLLDTPVDLSSVTTDSYIVAGVADHITPWENSYRTTQLLGGEKRFVLSNSGHIAAIVNPPTNKRATFRTAGTCAPADPEEWMSQSVPHEGSWWLDWNGWLAERDAGPRRAPRRMGSRTYPILGSAPGEYAHER